MELIFSIYFSISKDSFTLKLIFTTSECPQKPKCDIFQKALVCTYATSTNLVLKVVPIEAGQYFCGAFDDCF